MLSLRLPCCGASNIFNLIYELETFLLGYSVLSFSTIAAIIDIDTSGIHALEELHKVFLKRDLQVTTLTQVTKYMKFGYCWHRSSENIRQKPSLLFLILLVIYWQLALANPGRSVIDKLFASKFVDTIGQEWIFLTVGEAVQTCSRRLKYDVWRKCKWTML